MKVYVDQYFFVDWVTTIKCFIVEALNIKVQVLDWVLPSPAQLCQGNLGFCIEEIGIEGGHNMDLTLD